MPELTLTRQADLSHPARGAAARDARAWTHLVRRLDGVLHTAARPSRLTEADVDDVVHASRQRPRRNRSPPDPEHDASAWSSRST
jgi:hypothetical protein